MKTKRMPPIHPGKILLEDFLKPMHISQYRLAKDISVSARRINEIVHEKRAITADTASRLCRFFNMSAQFWMNLQSRFELEQAEDLLEERLDQEVQQYKAAQSFREAVDLLVGDIDGTNLILQCSCSATVVFTRGF